MEGTSRVASISNTCIQIILACCCTGLLHCTSGRPTARLQEGDLLFQDLDCGPLCDAIEAVTESRVPGKDFSHCGMVVKMNDTLMVIEAIGDQVQLNSLHDFFHRSGDSTAVKNVIIGRVKKRFRFLAEEAAEYATRQLGKPYDDAFLLNNGKWYCSELVYESFKKANGGRDFFEVQPMTFKDPATGAFFPAWETYYEELGVEIPEGQEGINPGLLSRSDNIRIVNVKDLP